jgi:hypothetical protein
MNQLKLMADYHCFPLWGVIDGEYGNIDPNELPLSDDVKAQLILWAKMYDTTLDKSDPVNSGFKTIKSELEFKEIGETLAKQLQQELGSAYLVVTHF